VIKENKINIGK